MKLEMHRFEREFKDGNGRVVRVRAELQEGSSLEEAILRLANKARASKRRVRVASALHGAFKVWVLSDEKED